MKKGDLEFLEDLLSRGYLPEELPPLFSTKLLSSITPKILEAEESFKTEPKHSKAIYFSIPKAKDMRRNLCIPNPHHQFMLSKAVVEHWDELQLFYDKSSLSLTKPVRKKHSLRSIQREHPFSEITRQNIIKSTAGRYMLKTDISRYYSTIYTHSISWALHGKNYAKNNSNNRNLLGNVLDFYIRNTKEQQTLGIPIGPDTSLVVSEILGTGIDQMLVEKIENIKGYRYVDDIYLFFRELGEAEKARYTIALIFSEFELEMNMEKTKIVALQSDEIEPEWVSELRLHTFNKKSEKDIISYFSKAFKLADEYPNDQVIKYAVKRIQNIEVDKKCWIIFESCLLKSALRDSIVLPILLDILVKHTDMILSWDVIEETMNYIIEFNSNYNNSYEILWSMWCLYWFDLGVSPDNIIRISKVDDPLVALMALFLNKEGFLNGELDLSLWMEHMKSDELYSNYWILAYEAYVREWLPSKSGKDFIKNRPFFDLLRKNDIRFTVDAAEFEEDEPDIEEDNMDDDGEEGYYDYS